MRFEEKIERVVDCHLGHEINFEAEFLDPLGKREACEIVALRVLLPVDEVRLWRDAQ